MPHQYVCICVGGLQLYLVICYLSAAAVVVSMLLRYVTCYVSFAFWVPLVLLFFERPAESACDIPRVRG